MFCAKGLLHFQEIPYGANGLEHGDEEQKTDKQM